MFHKIYLSMLLYLRRVPRPVLAVGALVVLLLGLSRISGCGAPVKEDPHSAGPLPPSTILDVKFSPNHVVNVRTEDGQERREYVPVDGNARITVTKDGVVEVDVKAAGVTFKPGMSALVTDRLRLGADVQLAYWNRLELHAGVAGPRIVGYGGIGYRLDQFGLNNTSVQVVYTTDRHVGMGLSVRF
jgi:hypothetical protein